jgi:predicted RNA-binding Zn ribbon-like protein
MSDANLTIGSFNRAAQVEVWRNKCREGTMTLEEYKQVIIALREGRKATSQATSGSKARKAKPTPISGDDLLSELDKL